MVTLGKESVIVLGQREGAYSMPAVESDLGSEGRESASQQLRAKGRPVEGGSSRFPATESRRGAWLVKKKKGWVRVCEAYSASQ